jgi:hypothetical protein
MPTYGYARVSSINRICACSVRPTEQLIDISIAAGKAFSKCWGPKSVHRV